MRHATTTFLLLSLLALAGCDSVVADTANCSDFATQDEAQRFFVREGGPENDPHRLDADNDGIACENL